MLFSEIKLTNKVVLTTVVGEIPLAVTRNPILTLYEKLPWRSRNNDIFKTNIYQ